MGISDLIPGVSGGTIALILGIYHELIASINGMFTKEWKKHSSFLLPIGIGIGIAVLTISHLMEWLLAQYPEPTFSFFLGLIIGIIPTLLKDINYKQNFTFVHYFLFVLAAFLVAATVFVKGNEMAGIISELTWNDYILLFFGGWLASSAMILPGVSGSFVFLLLGVYPTVINALSSLNFPVIFTVGLGIIIGLVLTSRLITILLVNYRIETYAVMVGFIVGSIVVIFPGITPNILLIFLDILAFLMGLLSAYLLSSIERRKLAKKSAN